MQQTAIDPIQYDTLVQNERVHRSLYTDPHIFTDELEKIFYHGWVFIAHESEIPQPGDFITRRVAPSRSSWCAVRTPVEPAQFKFIGSARPWSTTFQRLSPIRFLPSKLHFFRTRRRPGGLDVG